MGPTAQPSQATKPRLKSKISARSPSHGLAAQASANSLLIFDLKLPTSLSSREESRVPRPPSRVHRATNNVPFLPTTSASRAITLKGFLTTLTLSREEVVVMIRGPINRAQPPFIRFSLIGFSVFIPELFLTFSSLSRAWHVRDYPWGLDLSLRSPTNSILHRAVTGASVPTPFFSTCRDCFLSGLLTRSAQAESCDSQGRFPDSFPCISRLGNTSLRLREARILDICLYEALI
ncbi:hypothetical protein CRG98_015090 [Punica granatum]|uniref:Uncharacterized protein n=1 Tax=Punica granatum TaxID=22663 RepID=A0A2I0K7K4_PUNGR|nr:hypothetical protein CRG98_015090 [Punica granatum]